MSIHATLSVLLTVITTTTIVLSGTITYLAFRAARREGSRPLRLLSYGFGAITLGLLAGGMGALLFQLDAQLTLLVQGLLVAPGFVLLLRSVYAMSPKPDPVRETG